MLSSALISAVSGDEDGDGHASANCPAAAARLVMGVINSRTSDIGDTTGVIAFAYL